VVTNQRQYGITKVELGKFEEALAQQRASAPSPGVHPRIHKAMQDAMESEIIELRAQLQRYEDLRSGRVSSRTLTSLRELPVALIEGRIAARLTQRQLAERLGVPEQQVQRWEANSYSGVSVDRLQDTADALGIQLVETVEYAVPA
jgi:DNA-binding transcriptional regulator YiaG